MGVNTDGEEMGPRSTVTDGVKLTAEAREVVQETGNEKSLHQDVDGDVALRDQKPANGTGIPLIPFPKVPSQSSVLNTEHKEAQREHTDEGDSFLSNTTTTLQSDADIEDGNTKLFHGTPASLDTDPFADDICIPLEECTSPLQSAEIMDILETDAYDTSDAMYKTLLDGISPSDVSASKLELPFNHDIDQMDEEGYTSLYKAALEGHLEGVQDLISRGTNPNKPSKGGLRPLHAAAHEGHAHIVDFLILQGADVNEEDEKGNTPLIHAASGGHVKVMEYLIQQGSDVNKGDAKGWTPFNTAIQYGHLEAVEYIMAKGAEQNRYYGMSPLFAAALYGRLDIVEFFISEGADVNEEDDKGKIPLHGAAIHGSTEVMKYLIEQGSDVNKSSAKGWTPCNAAVQYGHLEAVKYLMTKGAELNRYAGMTPLYSAAKFGHIDLVNFFISNGADVNEEHDKGMIPLHGAAINGSTEVMKYLIEQGSDVNKSSAKGWTPFNAAVQYGHLEAVKYLMTKGAELNRYAGMTPLYSAAEFGHIDLVKFFISTGADVNEEHDKGMIPLHGAAIHGNTEVMEYLIQQGSDVDKADAKGWKPFNAAVQGGHLEAVKYLMTDGAKQNKYDGMTPLYAATVFGHLDVVKYLISNGADVNEENDTGKIALHGATAQDHTEVIEYLIQHGSDMNKGDAEGLTPFHAAIQYDNLEAVEYLMAKGAEQNRYYGMSPLFAAALYDHLDIVEFFISKGAGVNEENDTGKIPLHGAASEGHLKVMEYLIQQGSDVNKNDCRGSTPLHAAVKNGHLEVVKFLMVKGAKVNRLNGLTPLYIATQYDHVDVVNFLVSSGYDVNERNECGKSPLHAACYNGNIDIVKLLVQHNANVNEQDHDGWTPLEAAAQEGHQDIVDYLTLNGADMNLEDEDGLTPLQTATYTGHPHVTEGISSRKNDSGEEKEEDPRPRGNKNLITRGNVTVSLKDADTHARMGQVAPHVDSVEEGNDCTQADNAERGADELSMKNLPTWTHGDEKCANGEHNPFIHAKLKYPDKDEQDPMLDQMEDMKSPVTTNGADCSYPLGYRGFDAPFLQTMETDGHLYEKPVSRCYSLIDENRPMREPSSSMNAGNDLPINGTSTELERRDLDEEETGDLRPGVRQNRLRRLFLTVSREDADTQSRTGWLASQVDNVENRNDCIQADELSLKNFPTRTHDDDKGGNGEHNLFIHAKLKYPEEGEQDPMLEQLEAIKFTRTRTRDTITTGTDCSSLYGSQTRQYSGFDPPYLQTMETDGQPESRCHSLIDENVRESSSPHQESSSPHQESSSPHQESSRMNAGNDVPINKTPVKFESSTPKTSRSVVHQRSYDGNPVSTHETSSNPVWKIGTKRRTSVCRCPSILALVHTFLQMIIALAIILAGSPVLVAGSGSTERVTLQAGQPGVVSFHFTWPPNSTSHVVPYYMLRFESKHRPFCLNGEVDIEGFKNPSQLRRFSTSVTDLDTSPYVNLIIDNVDTLDEDSYLLTVVWHSFENVRYDTIQKEVDVRIPPGRAKCFITSSENSGHPYEVHCRATTGSVTTTLSCYQNDRKIDVSGDITDNGLITSGIFWLHDLYTHFSCCSHDVTLQVNETTCNDFEWPPIKETTIQIVNTVPTSVTTPIPQIESHTGSGACRQFMMPSLHYTYLFVYILALVTMY